jgi:molecular chaperone GrpE
MAKHDTHKKGAEKSDREMPANQPHADQNAASPTDTPGDAGAQAGVSEAAAATDSQNTGMADTDDAGAAKPEADETDTSVFEQEVQALKKLAAKKEAEAKEHYDRLTYLAAEFDNFRRRTLKEKERLFLDAVVEVTGGFLPVMDNLERAIKAAEAVESPEAVSLRDGVAMVAKQFVEALAKFGVTEIEALGASFDPNLHNAVMHVEDEAFGPNEVVDVFQKGYRCKEEAVVRHAMVKVAN